MQHNVLEDVVKVELHLFGHEGRLQRVERVQLVGRVLERPPNLEGPENYWLIEDDIVLDAVFDFLIE